MSLPESGYIDWKPGGLHNQHSSRQSSKITSEMAAFMEGKMEEDDESMYVCRATQTDSKAFLCEHFTTNHKKVHLEEGRVWSDLVLWFQRAKLAQKTSVCP